MAEKVTKHFIDFELKAKEIGKLYMQKIRKGKFGSTPVIEISNEKSISTRQVYRHLNHAGVKLIGNKKKVLTRNVKVLS